MARLRVGLSAPREELFDASEPSQAVASSHHGGVLPLQSCKLAR